MFDVPLCRYFDAQAVLWAVGATAVVSFSLTLFAMQTRVRSVTRAGPKSETPQDFVVQSVVNVAALSCEAEHSARSC